MQEHYATQSAGTSPIFQHLVADVLRARLHDIEPEDGETTEEALWRLMQMETLYKRTAYKCNAARYMAGAHDGKRLCRFWPCALFEDTVPTVEYNVVPRVP